MPALITHDTFGRDVYDRRHSFIGGTRDEADAFLLGNQGPDPLFYSVLSPRLHAVHRLGNRMHNEKPSELLEAFKQSLFVLKEGERAWPGTERARPLFSSARSSMRNPKRRL